MKRNICLKDPAFILLISNSPSDRADPHSSSSSAAWLFSVRLRLGVPRFQPHFENFRNYMFHVHDSRRSPRVLHDVRSIMRTILYPVHVRSLFLLHVCVLWQRCRSNYFLRFFFRTNRVSPSMPVISTVSPLCNPVSASKFQISP